MTDSAAQEVKILLVKQAISEVIFRYCRAMDRIDAELGYSVWHENAQVDYGSVFKGTGREFIDWVCEFHRGLVSHHHLVSNILISIDGDVAASESYIDTALYMKDEKDNLQQVCGRGRYLDNWSRRDGRWAIDQRQFVLDYATTKQVTTDTPAWGKRDATDPSYALSPPIVG